MKRMFIVPALALILCLGAALAFAGDTPNLVGEWKGAGKAVIYGKLGHTEPRSEPTFNSMEFTLRITKQDGERFFGERSSAKHKEIVLGLVEANGDVYIVDDDGVFFGEYDKATDSLKLRYMEPGKDSKVVASAVYTRKK